MTVGIEYTEKNPTWGFEMDAHTLHKKHRPRSSQRRSVSKLHSSQCKHLFHAPSPGETSGTSLRPDRAHHIFQASTEHSALFA